MGLWASWRGVTYGCGRDVVGSHGAVGGVWWGQPVCCGRVVAGSYRVVGEACIVDMATCGLHLGKWVVDGACTYDTRYRFVCKACTRNIRLWVRYAYLRGFG